MKQIFKLPQGLPDCLATLAGLTSGEWKVTVQRWQRARSLDQNALSHVWYAQIARRLREDTPGGVKRYCKLTFGIPLLRADDPGFSTYCATALDPLPYEFQLQTMEYMDVTRLLSSPQMTEYLEAIQAHYAGRVPLESING